MLATVVVPTWERMTNSSTNQKGTIMATGKTAKADEPTFEELVTTLAAADLAARSASQDATQARNDRSTAAVNAIRSAFSQKIASSDARTQLLDAGVLKGTVSKIITVVEALNAKTIGIGDVKSLNGAYSSVKMIATIAAGASPAPGVPYAAPVAAPTLVTPKDAIQFLIDTLKSVTDPDEAYKLGGEFITLITNGVSTALAAHDDDEE